jgi:acylphosphatase
VEFEVQGQDTQVDRFIERVKQAKYPAKVTDLHLTEMEVDDSSNSFQIIK